MALRSGSGVTAEPGQADTASVTLQAQTGETIDLPDGSSVRDFDMTREGADLILSQADGVIVIEGYFAVYPAPHITAPDGTTLTPELVDSFLQHTPQFAGVDILTDESPVGAVKEVTGDATITREDGIVESIVIGMPVFEGDVIQTDADGAVNIVFADETSFAVSEDARLAIDHYVFDADTESGATHFSVLKGVFVFTSGLIGRHDPDDVQIDTPVGSIGIRGTIIAGDVNTGEITVVEGAIVLKDFAGNEMTLAGQFETARFNPGGESIQNMGHMDASEVAGKFSSISAVSPDLFSSIQDRAAEQKSEPAPQDQAPEAKDAQNAAESRDKGDHSEEGGQKQAVPAAEEAVQNTEGEPAEPAVTETSTPDPAPAEIVQTGITEPAPGGTGSTSGTANNNAAANAGSGAGAGPASATQAVNPVVFTPAGPPPAFNFVETAQFTLTEETAGDVLAQFDARHGTVDTSSITITSPINGFADSFELVQTGSSTFDLKLKSGEALDWDQLQSEGITSPQISLGLTSTNGDVVNYAYTVGLNAVDEAPVHSEYAPEAFFDGAVEEGNWSHYFDKEFVNPDFNDPLSYELSTGTIVDLNALRDSAVLDSAQAGGNGWSFDSTDGKLVLFFDTLSSDQSVDIDIRAYDAAGNDTGFQTYTVTAHNETGSFSSSISDSNKTLIGRSSDAFNTDVTGSDNKIYLDDLYSYQVKISTGDNNTVYIGDFGGDAVLGDGSGAATENIVIGGESFDSFFIRDTDNQVFGMDGNDTFKMQISDTGIISDLQSGNDNGLRIHGGHDFFEFGNNLGDVIRFEGAGNIDFTAVHENYIQDIETIDINNAGAANIVTLSYSDVIHMTDHNNRLILNTDTGDSIVFSAEGETFTKSSSTETLAGETYDVYTGGDVTLLIDTDAASVSGLG